MGAPDSFDLAIAAGQREAIKQAAERKKCEDNYNPQRDARDLLAQLKEDCIEDPSEVQECNTDQLIRALSEVARRAKGVIDVALAELAADGTGAVVLERLKRDFSELDAAKLRQDDKEQLAARYLGMMRWTTAAASVALGGLRAATDSTTAPTSATDGVQIAALTATVAEQRRKLEVADDARTAAAEELARNVAELRRTKREHELAAASVQERAEQARTAQDFAERSRDAAYEAREKALEKLRAAEAALAEERTRYTDLERQTAQLREKVEADAALLALADETPSPSGRSDTEGEDDSESIDETGGPAPAKPRKKTSRSRAKPAKPRGGPAHGTTGDDVVVASGHQEQLDQRKQRAQRRQALAEKKHDDEDAEASSADEEEFEEPPPPLESLVAREDPCDDATFNLIDGQGGDGVIDGIDAVPEAVILARANQIESYRKKAGRALKKAAYDVEGCMAMLRYRAVLVEEQVPNTIEKAFKACHIAQRVAAERAILKFKTLATFVKCHFRQMAIKLGSTTDYEWLIEKAKLPLKHESGWGLGGSGNYRYKLAGFVLYVDYLLLKFGFTWEHIRFTDYSLFTTAATSSGKRNEHRWYVGLQFLANEDRFKDFANLQVSSDKADEPENATNLYKAMIKVRAELESA